MTGITRRRFLTTAASAGGAVLGLPGLWRPARAQTTLRLALWNHPVPGAKEAMQQLLAAWGKANHVEVQADFDDAQRAVVVAEARSQTGHDIIGLGHVYPCLYKEQLEPLNDVAADIIHQYSDFDDNARYSAYQDGTWLALPLSFAAWSHPLVSRMDYWQQDAGMDVTELFPADVTKRQARKIATFTWDTFLVACKRLAAAGHMFGSAISGCDNANHWLWPLLLSFGALPVTVTGDIAIESDATLAGIEFVVELSQFKGGQKGPVPGKVGKTLSALHLHLRSSIERH
jgi:ABC-type glycerol-3-phosphate transport system substrate-binding protein